jgi:hypothetical protein
MDSTALVVEALRAGEGVEPFYVEMDPGWQKQRREREARERVRAAMPSDLRNRLAPDQVVQLREIWPRTEANDLALYTWRRNNLGSAAQAADYSPQVPAIAAVGELFPGIETGYLATDASICDRYQREFLARHVGLPLAHISKAALLARARAAGFLDLLDLTWSCEGENFETVDGPCGRCLPCSARILPQIVQPGV